MYQDKGSALVGGLTFDPLLQPLTASLVRSASQSLLCALVFGLPLIFPLREQRLQSVLPSPPGKELKLSSQEGNEGRDVYLLVEVRGPPGGRDELL